MIPFPNKKYQIIYADPPWSYKDKMKGHSFSLDHEYETQSLEWIKNLPVKNISEKDCALFLWVTSPLLDKAFEVIKSWGFKYKTVAFCWNKKTNKGNQVFNLGKWTMGSVELCLIATKGKPQRINKSVKQIVNAERTKHSKKPDEIKTRITDIFGNLSRIELFARQKTDGWDVWGNEVNNEGEKVK